jgi:hypothetical protein
MNKEEMKMKKYEHILSLINITLNSIEWSLKNAPYCAELLQPYRVDNINTDLSDLYAMGIY